MACSSPSVVVIEGYIFLPDLFLRMGLVFHFILNLHSFKEIASESRISLSDGQSLLDPHSITSDALGRLFVGEPFDNQVSILVPELTDLCTAEIPSENSPGIYHAGGAVLGYEAYLIGGQIGNSKGNFSFFFSASLFLVLTLLEPNPSIHIFNALTRKWLPPRSIPTETFTSPPISPVTVVQRSPLPRHSLVYIIGGTVHLFRLSQLMTQSP